MPSKQLLWWPAKGPPKAVKALTASPAVLDGLRERGWTPWRVLGGSNRQRIIDAYNTAQSANYAWMYSNSPAVRTVIDVLVRNIGQLDLRLYEEISEAEREPRPDHPAALSLRYPSLSTSGDQLVRQLVKDFLIFDNAYALLTEAPGDQLTLNWIPAHMMEIRGPSLFEADGYRAWNLARDGTFVDFPPERILHWRGENPHDPRMGHSLLETLRNVIAEDAALQQATVELAQAGMTEPAWVYRPLEAPDWSNEDRQRFEEDLNNRVRRRNKTPVVLEEGMEMKSFGVSPREAQMFEVRRWAIQRVASAYGVPLGMVGLDDNLKEAQQQFYTDVLPPYCEAFTKMLNHRILVRAYSWPAGCFEFNLDEKHMGDDRIKSLVSATGRAVMLTNEARAKLNLPPVDAGDELVTPLNVIVGDNPKPSPQVMPPQQPGRPSQDGEYRREEPKAIKADPPEEPYQQIPQFVDRRRQDIARQHQYVEEVERALKRYYRRQQRTFREKANEKAANTDRWNRELLARLDELISGIVEREGQLYVRHLAGGEFDMGQVQNYIAATSKGVAEAINDATQQDIDEFGPEDAFVRAIRERATVAAASIGSRSTIFAREEAAKQAPGYETRLKTWVADTKRHAQWDGTTIPVGDEWPSGFAPGSPPNCRCSIAIQ